MKTFEKLHICRHHDGRRPIFHGEPQLVARLAFAEFLFIDRRMMLQDNVVAERAEKNRRRLVDDRGERNGVDDPVEIIPLRFEREGEGGQCFAAPRRHGEGDEATIGFCAVAHMREVDRLVRETLIDRFVDRLTQASALR